MVHRFSVPSTRPVLVALTYAPSETLNSKDAEKSVPGALESIMNQPNQPVKFFHQDPRYVPVPSPYPYPHPHNRLERQTSASWSPFISHVNPLGPTSPASTEYSYNVPPVSPHGSWSGAEIGTRAVYPDYGPNRDMSSISGMIMPTPHRSSVGSVTSMPFQQRSGSVPGSDHWSPSSGRVQGQNNSDESLSHNADRSTLDRKQMEDDEKPAWTELKTKAGKERKRLPLACIACRRKKIRCSGEKPACKHCVRARIPCVYKVTARKAAPRTDYMAMLDKRLRRMEERVIKVIPKDELPDTTVTGRSSVRPPIPGTTKEARPPSSKKRSADEAFVHEINQWTSGKKAPGMPDTAARLRKQREGESKLFTEGASELPSPQIQEHLAEVFFDCIYGQSYLLLHKPSFMRKLKSGTVPPVLILAVCAIAARFSTHPQLNTDPGFLRGEQWATPARKIVEKRHYEPNITILTVMLILGLHYFGTCEGGLSWSFGGQAMRMAYALQLHREASRDSSSSNKEKNVELSFTDREIRRRTMWACFLMDTFNSSGTGRPSFGNEEYLHIQLPIKESHFQMEVPGPTEDLEGNIPNPTAPNSGQITDPKENMGVAAYVIRAVVMWKRIVKYLNLGGKERDPHILWDNLSQFADLRRQIKRLKESLPASLVYTEENLENHSAERVANQFLYLHIIIAQCTLFLNRFAIPTSPLARAPKGMPKPFLNEASQLVVEAANQISTLIEVAAGHNLNVPFAGYCAYASSTVQVWGIFSKNPQLEATSKENLRHNYKYLDRMRKYWGMFHYMAESVKDTYRQFADAAITASNHLKAPSAHSGALTPDQSRQGTPMFQYGDWFDKYPHGVSEAEWEEGHHEYKKEQGAEAVMSQRSDLQSVEEFFASLSPPSKAEDSQTGKVKHLAGAGGKVARKRGKSSADNQNRPDRARTTTETGVDPSAMNIDIENLNTAFTPEHHQQQQPQSQPGYIPPFNSNFMDNQTTSPTQLYPPAFSNQNFLDFSSLNFNFGNFPNDNALPVSQLDRQMVFGAYAGIDPSITSANMGLPGMDTSGIWDNGGGLDLNGGLSTGDGFLGGGGPTGMGSAWFMPFNLDPPLMSGNPAGGSVDLDGPSPGLGGGLVMGDFDGSFSAQAGQVGVRRSQSSHHGGGREGSGCKFFSDQSGLVLL